LSGNPSIALHPTGTFGTYLFLPNRDLTLNAVHKPLSDSKSLFAMGRSHCHSNAGLAGQNFTEAMPTGNLARAESGQG